jgi:hypothetical protein
MTIPRNLSFLAEGASSTGVLGVPNGGSGATTLTGYLIGNGASAFTASATIPTTALSGTVTNAQLTNSAITINGTSTSLGGSISVGTVTSVAALTLQTTGTDLSSTVTTGTTTPVITLNVPTASASNRGVLSSSDWTTFNGKAPGVTFTSTYIPYGQGTTTLNQSSALTFDGTNFATTGNAQASVLKATLALGSGATVDTSGQTGIVVSTTSNALLISGGSYYLIAIAEITQTGQNAVYVLGNGSVSLLGGTSYWVASTTTPGTTSFSIAYSGGNYRLYNGCTAAGTYTFKATIIKMA